LQQLNAATFLQILCVVLEYIGNPKRPQLIG